ncbi:MAG: enoyl-CoA hydratase/isomerase family protein [candidate division Zixibacteria bacterium]|nr:enoyl-CoA hydratase/isomerase family protein [candidate division Zixibacteria bacterium]
MPLVNVERLQSTAVVTLSRPPVNAINEQVVAELSQAFRDLERDNTITSIVLTGGGKFFSFGLDVPELYDHTPEQFRSFLISFCALCRQLFLFPKPIVAAINGHAVAGGCVLLLPCDARIAADIPMKVGLTEITLGASLFASTVEMLRYWLTNQHAERLLLVGSMFDAREAQRIGLFDQVVEKTNLQTAALQKAAELATHHGPGYEALRRHIRQPVADRWMAREDISIDEFVSIWYTPETRRKTREVKIRS